MMKFILFYLFINFYCLAGLNAQSKNDFVINAVIDTVPNATYFIRYGNAHKMIHDTVSLDSNSKFLYKGTIAEPTIFSLRIPNIYNSKIIGDFVIYSFWIQPGKTMLLKGNKGWLTMGKYGLVANSDKFTIENSDLDSIQNSYKKKISDIINLRIKEKDSLLTDNERFKVYDSIRNNFILCDPKNYYGLYLINEEMRNVSFNYDLVKKWYDSYPKSLQSTFLGEEIYTKILAKKNLDIGRILPDFEQSDTSSNLIKLSNFRGKYVLVDFWASWCGPCRKEHPYLVEAYKKFKSKGFEIISISVDSNRLAWLKAIQDDGLSWVQLSDLKGFSNDIARRFMIRAVPESFLLDPEGKIIAKGLRGEQVNAELKKLLAD